MKPLHIQTPLLASQALHNAFQKQISFKLELLQPSGSFKLRGIGQLCQQEKARGITSFVASSGGNAGVAVAYAGMKLGVKTTVFIPKSSHPLFIEAIKSYGAELIIAGDVWKDAHDAAEAFSRNNNASYIHPFDHPVIWSGHSTMIDELIQQYKQRPDAVIVSVGGGGLACGVLEGMHRVGWKEVPLIAVETVGADVFAQSVQANQPVTLSKITSRATSLGSSYATPALMAWTKKHPIYNVVVNDDEAEYGSRAFAKDKRMLVELSSGASLSLVCRNHPIIQPYSSICVIVCGGLNTSFFNLT